MKTTPFLLHAILVALLSLVLSACSTFQPGSLDQLPVRERSLTIEKDDLRVSVAVLSSAEAQQLFGANLARRGVQAVWLEVENRSDKPYWFMMHALDPNYFSAREVAYMNHLKMNKKANSEMDEFFSANRFRQHIMPGKTNSGFAFSNETRGTKEVRVRLYTDKQLRDFDFFVAVPGLVSDWDRTDLTSIYSSDELLHIDSEQELRKALTTLPCCTQRANGNGAGDMLNVALIGGENTLMALINTGWDETIFLDDLQSFVGAYYLFGRRPDVQFDKPRRRISSTMELRLWVTRIRYRGKAVAVGSIRRDTDPNIDDAPIYLAESLITAGRLKRFGYVEAMEPVSKNDPRNTIGNQAYWTNGNRIVIEISDELVGLNNITTFDWDWRNRQSFDTQAQLPEVVAVPE